MYVQIVPNREIASDDARVSVHTSHHHLESDMYVAFLEAPDPSVCTLKPLLGLVTHYISGNLCVLSVSVELLVICVNWRSLGTYFFFFRFRTL